MAGTGALFRSTLITDTEVSLGSTEKIEFNLGAVPDARGNLTNSSVHYIRDISTHPNPNVALNKTQDGKLASKEIIIAGYFTEPNSAAGITNLNNWMKDPTAIAALPFGRFGIRLDDISILNLTASGGTGYMLHDVFIERPENSPNEATFVAKLLLNGAAV